MATNAKVLVVDSDLNALSRIYLALVHRNYNAEASDTVAETRERMQRLKPAVLIIGEAAYLQLNERFKIPVIVLMENESSELVDDAELRIVEKSIPLDMLIQLIEELVV